MYINLTCKHEFHESANPMLEFGFLSRSFCSCQKEFLSISFIYVLAIVQELDPPPWLNRMREIGYPPGYLGTEYIFLILVLSPK